MVAERKKSRVIDVHAHAMPFPLINWLAREGLADLSQLTEGSIRLDPRISGLPSRSPIPYSRRQYDPSERVRAMDVAGIDVAVLSAPPYLFCSSSTDDALVNEVINRSNEALLAFAAEAPNRFAALATLPMGSSYARREAERSIKAGFVGFTIGSCGMGRELDDVSNESVWEFASEEGVFIFLHPSRASSPERLDNYHLLQLLGYPTETALAAARLAFSGVLERYELRICLAHGGGCLPSVLSRLDLGWKRKASAATVGMAPSTMLRQLYFDSAVFDPGALKRLVDQFGVSQILVGTDSPFDLEDSDPVGLVGAAIRDEKQRRAVLSHNAMRLLNIKPEGLVRSECRDGGPAIA